MRICQILATAMFLAVSTATAQTALAAQGHIAMGDKEYAARNAKAALMHYQEAIAADSTNVEALWKASRTAVVLGEFSDSTRDTLYNTGIAYGQRAVAIDSNNVNALFALTYAEGRMALTKSNPVRRLPFSRDIYKYVTKCLKLAPQNAECAHIYGEWHAEAMRVGDTQRSMAVQFMGATELGTASWDSAAKYLQQAIKAEPKRAIHHYDLARTYVDMKDKAKAKAEFEAVIKAPVSDFNDPQYKADAQKQLKELTT